MDKGFGKGSFLRDAPRFRGRDNHGYHEKLARASSLRNEFKAAPPHSLSTALKLLCENFTCANRSCRLDRLTPAFQRKWEEGPPDRRLVKIRFPYRQVSGKCAFLPFTSTMMCCVLRDLALSFEISLICFWSVCIIEYWKSKQSRSTHGEKRSARNLTVTCVNIRLKRRKFQ